MRRFIFYNKIILQAKLLLSLNINLKLRDKINNNSKTQSFLHRCRPSFLGSQKKRSLTKKSCLFTSTIIIIKNNLTTIMIFRSNQGRQFQGFSKKNQKMPINLEVIVNVTANATNISVVLPPTLEISSPTKIGDEDESNRQCHGVLYDVVLVVPAVLFVVYLAVHAKKNLRKLCNGSSYIMIAYYALLWLACLLNLAWCSLQVSCFSFLISLFSLQLKNTKSGFSFTLDGSEKKKEKD